MTSLSGTAVALALLGLAAAPVRAQQAPDVVWASGEIEPAAAWVERLGHALEVRGATVTHAVDAWAYAPPGAERSSVQALAEVQARLRRAHDERAELRHGQAIAALLEAEQLALGALSVPGAAAFYAEVEIELAITAAETGQVGIAEAALARACTVDPGRAVGAAEAPPDFVARAEAVRRALATGPRGTFEVRASDAPAAAAFLDDRSLGPTPVAIEASVGRHVLRLEASGFRPWARVIDVQEGPRAPVVVVLSPDPAVEAARALRAASLDGPSAAVASWLGVLEAAGRAPRALWLVEAGDQRALAFACTAAGCRAPVRLLGGEIGDEVELSEGAAPSASERTIAEARRWLGERPPPVTPWWEEPWLWIMAGALVAAGTAAVIGATWPEPPTRLEFHFDGNPIFGR